MDTIEYLCDLPEHIETVSGWLFQTWGAAIPGNTPEKSLQKLKNRSLKGMIPSVFVCLRHGAPLGTAAITEHDMEERKDLGPWLAGVYVVPGHRRKGIATKMVNRVHREARMMGLKELYLYTPDMAPFYETLGWKLLEKYENRGQRVDIMIKKL